jgi:hypothetical protein
MALLAQMSELRAQMSELPSSAIADALGDTDRNVQHAAQVLLRATAVCKAHATLKRCIFGRQWHSTALSTFCRASATTCRFYTACAFGSRGCSKLLRVNYAAHASIYSVPVQLTDTRVGAEPMCVVCLERPRTMAVYPCGHRCLCTVDSPRFVGAACPICRGPVTSVLTIFDA